MATVTKIAVATIACPAVLQRNINNDISIVPVCQNIRIDNGTSITFTFSTALSVAEDTQLDTLITNLVCNTTTVSATIEQITGTIFPMIFSYGDTASDKWLSYPGETSISSDHAQAIIPFDCKLTSICFGNSKGGRDTDVELHHALINAGGSATTSLMWQLRSVRTARKSNFASEILFSAGDKIGIYCKEISDNNPKDVVVTLYLQITNINNEEQIEDFTSEF